MNMFENFFSKALYYFFTGFLSVIDGLESAFKFLAGSQHIGSVENGNDLISMMLEDALIISAAKYFFIIAALFFLMALGLALIKFFASPNKENGIGKIIKSSTLGFLAMIGVTLIVVVAVMAVGILLQGITLALNGGSGGESIATAIFQANITDWTIRDAFITGGFGWNTSLDTLQKQIDLNITLSGGDINYVMAFISGGMVLWALLSATIQLGLRILKIVFYYVSGVFPAAMMPLDNGERFNTWKDQFLGTLLGAAGSVMIMYIYINSLGVAGKIFGDAIDQNPAYYVTLTIAQLCLIIGGSFAISQGNQWVAEYVKAGLGQNEALSMTQSQMMMQGGMKLASMGGKLAFGSAKAAASGGASVGTNAASAGVNAAAASASGSGGSGTGGNTFRNMLGSGGGTGGGGSQEGAGSIPSQAGIAAARMDAGLPISREAGRSYDKGVIANERSQMGAFEKAGSYLSGGFKGVGRAIGGVTGLGTGRGIIGNALHQANKLNPFMRAKQNRLKKSEDIQRNEGNMLPELKKSKTPFSKPKLVENAWMQNRNKEISRELKSMGKTGGAQNKGSNSQVNNKGSINKINNENNNKGRDIMNTSSEDKSGGTFNPGGKL